MEKLIKTDLLKLVTYQAEKKSPQKFVQKTGRVVKLLAKHNAGLTKDEIHVHFYERFHSASFRQRESLRMSVEKVIQRSRVKFKENNLTILYDKSTKKYQLAMRQFQEKEH